MLSRPRWNQKKKNTRPSIPFSSKIKILKYNDNKIGSYPVLGYVDHFQIRSLVDHFGPTSSRSVWGEQTWWRWIYFQNRFGGSRRVAVAENEKRETENESNSNGQPADRRQIEYCPRDIVVGGIAYGVVPFTHPHTHTHSRFENYFCFAS